MKRSQRQILERRLRAEGAGQTPGHSRLLHERVMAGLRAGEGGKPVIVENYAGAMEKRKGGVWVWRIAVPAAVAAAIGVVSWVVLMPGAGKGAEAGGAGVVAVEGAGGVPAMPTFADVKEAFATRAAAVDEAKYAYLDRDVQRLAVFVADQMPALPEGAGEASR